MGTKKPPKNTWILVAGGVAVAALVGFVVMLDTSTVSIYTVIQAAALLGYLAVFFTSLSALFIRELTRFFGRSFMTIHHIVAIVGLSMLTLHAATVAWDYQSIRVFLPRFDSLQAFLELAGRPALWIFALTALTALMRKTIGKSWKTIHWLNYLAFLLGTIHAQLIGSSFQHLGIRIISAALAIILVWAFIWRRTRKRRLQRALQAKKQTQ